MNREVSGKKSRDPKSSAACLKTLSKCEYSSDSSEVSVISSSQWKNGSFLGIFNAVKNTDFMKRIFFIRVSCRLGVPSQ